MRIIARLNVGGPALHVINLGVGLRDRYPTLLVAGSVAEGEADMTESALDRGIEVEILPRLGREIRLGSDLIVLAQLLWLMLKVRPTIVHTHTAKAGTLGRVAAILARVPVRVHTFHGHVFHGYFGARKSRAFLAVERLLARFTTRIIAISDQQRAELIDTFQVAPADMVQVIPLGLELDRFANTDRAERRRAFRSELGEPAAPVIACVGRLVPVKNHELLLEAASVLAADDIEFLLLIVGGGTEEQRLRQRVVELGLAKHVRFLGWRSDLENVYAGSDIIALSSVNEGTPVCLIEALAAGKQIVATDVGGVRDVLENGNLGAIVPSGNVNAFAAGLKSAIEHWTEEISVGRSESALRRYGADRLSADISRLYDELVAERAASHPMTLRKTPR